jgi:hypothetical protein
LLSQAPQFLRVDSGPEFIAVWLQRWLATADHLGEIAFGGTKLRLSTLGDDLLDWRLLGRASFEASDVSGPK